MPMPDEAGTARWAHRVEGVAGRGYRSAAEIAEAEKVTRSFVNRLLRLTLLSPGIVEAMLDGRQAKGMQQEDLSRAMPSEWKERLNQLIIASGA